MKLAKLIGFFLIINFGGLAIGSWLMNNGPMNDWYTNLNQAPWTPPGWVFGVAWTIIMICFSIYLGYLFTKNTTVKLKVVYIVQVFLNVIWNYIFFNQHLTTLGLVSISLLTVVIFYFFFNYKKEQRKLSYLLMPYMLWLLIATSLNGYIVFYN